MESSKVKMIIFIVIAVVAGFWYGDQRGYNRAKVEIKKVEEETAQKAAQDAAKAANPFQAVNPLSDVKTNPFEKAKEVINPFK